MFIAQTSFRNDILLPIIPLVKKLGQMEKMVIPLVPMVQMLLTNGTIGRTPNTRIAWLNSSGL